MKKKILTVMLGVTMAAALLAGCGSSQTEENAEASEGMIAPDAENADITEGDEGMDEDYPENFLEERCAQYVFDSYDEIIGLLEDGEAYGYAKVMGSEEEVLFITNETFDGYGEPACLECFPYYKNADGKYECAGVVSSASTATPVSITEDGQILSAGHDVFESDVFSQENGALMVLRYISCQWQEDGTATYSGFIRETNSIMEDGTAVAEDDEAAFSDAFAEFDTATPIAFTVVGTAEIGINDTELWQTEDWSISYDPGLFYAYASEEDENTVFFNYTGECAGTSIISVEKSDKSTVEEAYDELAESVELGSSTDISVGEAGYQGISCARVADDGASGVVIDDVYIIIKAENEVYVITQSVTRDTDDDRAMLIADRFLELINSFALR